MHNDMPVETQAAVEWALQQSGVVVEGVIDKHMLVDMVRRYFDDHGIECRPMSADDLERYLPIL